MTSTLKRPLPISDAVRRTMADPNCELLVGLLASHQLAVADLLALRILPGRVLLTVLDALTLQGLIRRQSRPEPLPALLQLTSRGKRALAAVQEGGHRGSRS